MQRSGRVSAVAGLMLLGLALGGCASTIADAPLMGLPAGTPARPANPGEYLPVHDLPAPRQETVLDQAQRDKLEKDLLAARDRQASGARAAERRSN
jgi:Spy/CpxP family protein refolding chaperone